MVNIEEEEVDEQQKLLRQYERGSRRKKCRFCWYSHSRGHLVLFKSICIEENEEETVKELKRRLENCGEQNELNIKVMKIGKHLLIKKTVVKGLCVQI